MPISTLELLNKKIKFSRVVFGLLIVLVLICMIYPIFWIFLTSFKQLEDFRRNSPLSFPERLDFSNYRNAIINSKLGLYFKNSFLLTFVSVTGIIFLSAMAAFALEKTAFRFRKLTLTYFISGIIVPIHVTLIPLFLIYKTIRMLDTYLALIIPYIAFGLPMAIYIFTSFYRFIPEEIIEAAVIDGCSMYRLFFRIILPISTNTIVTVATLNFVFTWNDFIFANTFVNKSPMRTVILGLQDYVGQWGQVDLGATFSAISITVIPIFIVYFLLNKKIISGMTAGAVKG